MNSDVAFRKRNIYPRAPEYTKPYPYSSKIHTHTHRNRNRNRKNVFI